MNRLSGLIFSVFFLGFLAFFASQVIRMTFGNTSGLPDPVSTTAAVTGREKENATQRASSNATPRLTTYYRLIVTYKDGGVTRQGTYSVTEDVYSKYEEGSPIQIYYYPGTSLSGYGAPPSRTSRRSSFENMSKLIGVFMLAVAGMMAFGFVRGMMIPMLTGRTPGRFSVRFGRRMDIPPSNSRDRFYDDRDR